LVTGTSPISDDLIERAAAGSAADLERLTVSVQPQIRLMVVVRLTPKPPQFDQVDDIVQDVLVGLTEGLRALQTRTLDGLRAFLSGIASRQVALFLRREAQREPAGHALQSLDSTIASSSNAGPLWQFLSSSGTSPVSAADRDERVARLLAELGALPSEYREVITYAYADQLTPSEIGRRMGLSRNAASMLLLRASGALRQRMAIRAPTVATRESAV